MSNIRKLLIAATLVIAATCAALPFMRGPTPNPMAENARLNLRGVDAEPNPSVLKTTPTDSASPADLSVGSLSAGAVDAPASAVTIVPSLAELSPPPQLSEDYPMPLQPVSPAGGQSNLDGGAVVAQREESDGPEISTLLRRHLIRDGDSLESLAQRYLGSRQRAEEIFAANRKVLSSRDLLPIGAEIEIPAQSDSP